MTSASPGSTPPTHRRADAQRNRAMILTAASEVFLQDGANASLEEIARRAGLGSATLHRHFATRQSLLVAVFADVVDGLCLAAAEISAHEQPGEGLAVWLTEMARHCARSNALTTLVKATPGEANPQAQTYERLSRAGAPLRRSAVRAGLLRKDVTITDLLALVNGIATASSDDPSRVDRLLKIAWTGLEPRRQETRSM